MATFIYALPNEKTTNYFKKGCWYKGKDTEKGITAKYSGNPEQNSGWWSGTFAKNYFRLITPSKFEKITSSQEIKRLELLLINEIK